jgi:hypothetical protein
LFCILTFRLVRISLNRIAHVFAAGSAHRKKDTKKKEDCVLEGMAPGICFGIAIYSEGGYEHG